MATFTLPNLDIDFAVEETPTECQPIELQVVQFGDYCHGQLRYLRREPISNCDNNHQRRGWWAALAHDSYCETRGYLVRTGQIDPDSIPF